MYKECLRGEFHAHIAAFNHPGRKHYARAVEDMAGHRLHQAGSNAPRTTRRSG